MTLAGVDRAVHAVSALGAVLGRAFQWDGQLQARNVNAPNVFSGTGAPAAPAIPGNARTGDLYFRVDGGHSSAIYQYDGSTWAVVAGSSAIPPFATPSIALGTAAAAGASGSVIRADATVVAFDATVPVTQAFADAAAAGAAAVAARRDHKHGMPATPATTNFNAGADQTGSRALATPYTNGSRRRRVYVTALCQATLTAKAFIGYVTVAGGTTLTAADAAGLPAGVADSANVQVSFPVDPGAAYQATSDVAAGGSVSIVQWIEVDE